MFMPHITKETTTQTTKNIGNYEKYIYIYIRKTLRKIKKQQKTIVAAEEGETTRWSAPAHGGQMVELRIAAGSKEAQEHGGGKAVKTG